MFGAGDDFQQVQAEIALGRTLTLGIVPNLAFLGLTLGLFAWKPLSEGIPDNNYLYELVFEVVTPLITSLASMLSLAKLYVFYHTDLAKDLSDFSYTAEFVQSVFVVGTSSLVYLSGFASIEILEDNAYSYYFLLGHVIVTTLSQINSINNWEQVCMMHGCEPIQDYLDSLFGNQSPRKQKKEDRIRQ